MVGETETVLDRRRLRRSLSLWRGLGVLAIVLAIGVLAFGSDKTGALGSDKQIARVAIEGTITEDRKLLKLLKEIEEDDNVSAMLLYVNSPGGTTTGGEAIYEAIRRVSYKKPVVAQFGTLAASAGYIVGLAADHIVARGNTITGSVGVIMQWPEVTELLDSVGVKMREVKSGKLKARPSPFEKLTEDGRQVAQGMIDDGFKWFLALVEKRRNVKIGMVPGLVDGAIYSGREALAEKLVDQIGGENEAVEWLQTEKKLDPAIEVVDRKPKGEGFYGFGTGAGAILGYLFGPAAGKLTDRILSAHSNSYGQLDGLLSVWHPSEK